VCLLVNDELVIFCVICYGKDHEIFYNCEV
jgi:hypothetical protein